MKGKLKILILLPILVLGCRNVEQGRAILLVHGLDVTHSVHKAMVYMGEELARLSGGKMRLEIYPNQQFWNLKSIR